jgi:hypothetical protein
MQELSLLAERCRVDWLGGSGLAGEQDAPCIWCEWCWQCEVDARNASLTALLSTRETFGPSEHGLEALEQDLA